MTQNLNQYSNVPLKYSTLLNIFSDYKSPKDKIDDLLNQKVLIRLKRGVFIVNPKDNKAKYSLELIANQIYGPSYVSLESALYYYGLIPERVFTTQSVISKRKKSFNTPLGLFEYHKVPKEYFPIGIEQISSTNNSFLIAGPEKALCDIVLIKKGLRFQSKIAAKAFIYEDLRLNIDQIDNWNLNVFKKCIEFGQKKRELKILLKIIKDEFI